MPACRRALGSGALPARLPAPRGGLAGGGARLFVRSVWPRSQRSYWNRRSGSDRSWQSGHCAGEPIRPVAEERRTTSTSGDSESRLGSDGEGPPLVLLHGWTSNSESGGASSRLYQTSSPYGRIPVIDMERILYGAAASVVTATGARPFLWWRQTLSVGEVRTVRDARSAPPPGAGHAARGPSRRCSRRSARRFGHCAPHTAGSSDRSFPCRPRRGGRRTR